MRHGSRRLFDGQRLVWLIFFAGIVLARVFDGVVRVGQLDQRLHRPFHQFVETGRGGGRNHS